MVSLVFLFGAGLDVMIGQQFKRLVRGGVVLLGLLLSTVSSAVPTQVDVSGQVTVPSPGWC